MAIGVTFKLLTLTMLHDKKREKKQDKPMPRKLFCEISPLTYKIFREISSKETGLLVNRELILSNHSKVMYDAKHILQNFNGDQL